MKRSSKPVEMPRRSRVSSTGTSRTTSTGDVRSPPPPQRTLRFRPRTPPAHVRDLAVQSVPCRQDLCSTRRSARRVSKQAFCRPRRRRRMVDWRLEPSSAARVTQVRVQFLGFSDAGRERSVTFDVWLSRDGWVWLDHDRHHDPAECLRSVVGMSAPRPVPKNRKMRRNQAIDKRVNVKLERLGSEMSYVRSRHGESSRAFRSAKKRVRQDRSLESTGTTWAGLPLAHPHR